MFDLFVTPLVSVFVTGYLTLAVIGPIFTTVEDGIINGVQALIQLPYGIGSFVMGGLYAITVVAGIHHMYTLIDVGQLAKFGYTYWLPLASAANVAQGGAALAVALKSKNQPRSSPWLCPPPLSACMGITEPAIFGVNLRYFKPFIGGLAGGACGALYASIVGLGATGTGVTGIFGILLHLHMPLAVHHRHAHCFRCRIRCDLGDLEAGRRKRIKTAKGRPQEGASPAGGGGENLRLAAAKDIASPSVSFADSASPLALRATSPVSGESVSQREPFI